MKLQFCHKVKGNERPGEHGPMVRISRTVFHEMVDHAKKEQSAECCGFLAGKDGLATRLYRLENQVRSRTSYLADPQQQLQALKEMEDLGLDLLAIYHSHPDTESYPSPVDVEKAFFGEALCIIISLKDQTPRVRAFRVARSGEITEERIEVF